MRKWILRLTGISKKAEEEEEEYCWGTLLLSLLHCMRFSSKSLIFIQFILFIWVLGILTLFMGIYYIKKFVFGPVRKSKVSPYLKYLLLRDKGWCLQAVRTAGHTLDSTSKPLLVSEVLD